MPAPAGMRDQSHPTAHVRLRQIVELLRVAAALDPRARYKARRRARELRLELGDSVPKLPLARALGVSVKALDNWVAKGEIPTLSRPGAGRSRVEADAILDLLEEASELRLAGVAWGVDRGGYLALTGGTGSRAFVLRTSAVRGGRAGRVADDLPRDRVRPLPLAAGGLDRRRSAQGNVPWEIAYARSARWQGASGSGESLQCGARRRSSAGRALHS